MTRNTTPKGLFLTYLLASLAASLIGAVTANQAVAEEVLFEDSFDKGLSDKWKIVGFEKSDYRLRDGGLEVRVQPTPEPGKAPMIQIVLPFTTDDMVSASVKVTLLDKFTEEAEFAGMYLTDESGIEFAAKKQIVNRQMMFAPGRYKFIGKEGEQGNPDKFDVIYTVALPEAGPLRILVHGGYGYFQVGPADADRDKYLNFFHSALRKDSKVRGFCLTTWGAPKDKEHWVRFDDFKVVRN
jgi:hypothetical protein